MKTVARFLIPFDRELQVDLPSDVVFLSLEEQSGVIWLWTLADLNSPHRRRSFRLLGEGDTVDDGAQVVPIGSTTIGAGAALYHLVEIR